MIVPDDEVREGTVDLSMSISFRSVILYMCSLYKWPWWWFKTLLSVCFYLHITFRAICMKRTPVLMIKG